MIRVLKVRPGSIGETLEITPGTLLLRMNGRPVRDSLDLLFLQSEESLELEAELPDGSPVVFEVEKDADESLGLVPEPDKIRRCTNACPFCFVKGNPKLEKLRAGLYIKDDDYRLSFLHGHYITLTNLRDDDWERIAEQQLSPLYVSVHATDPDVRLKMLVNPRSAAIDSDLDRLQAAGIEFHAQVVLCPELNDGLVLERTMEDLYARGEGVLSLSVVPVGLTRFNQAHATRVLTVEECRAALTQVDRARSRALRERGRGWCYASDELFLQAGLDLPPGEYFDDPELVGNGVGAITLLAERVAASVGDLPSLHGKQIVLVTGTSMEAQLESMAESVAAVSGARVAVASRENTLYGPMVTTAGLLSGRDHLEALTPYAGFDLALFSHQALNEDGQFLDDLSLDELRTEIPTLEIWPSATITDVLTGV